VNCLDAETLATWFDGGLKGAALEDVRAHVAGCDRCQMLLGAMARTRAAVPAPAADRAGSFAGASEPRPRRWLAWAVPLAAAATAIAVWVAIPEQRSVPVPTPAAAPATPVAAPAETQQAAPSSAAPPPAETREAAPRFAAPPAGTRQSAQAPAPATPPPAVVPGSTQGAAPSPTALRKQEEAANDAARQAPQSLQEAVALRAPAAARVSPSCGAEWTAPPAVAAGPLTASSGPSMAVCWMVGRAGTILRSTDHQSWQRVNFPEMTDLSAVLSTSAQDATVSSADGRTWTTSDGGMTWVQR